MLAPTPSQEGFASAATSITATTVRRAASAVDSVSTGGAHGDQRLAEPLPLLPGPGERLLKQLVGDDARLHENLAQAERRREAVQGGGIMVAAVAGRQSSLYVDSVSLLFQGRGRGGRLLYVTTSSGPEYR